MTIQKILRYPDKKLRIVAKKVTNFNTPELIILIKDMFETMHDASGIGLAATQIDIHQQIIVMDIPNAPHQPLVLINPIITQKKEYSESTEGCLSVPGFLGTLQRYKYISISYHDPIGHLHHLDADDLLSICIQHECDHLKGIVYVDRLQKKEQQKIREKILENN